MKFKSRKDLVFSIFTFGTVLVLVATSYYSALHSSSKFLWVHALAVLGIIFLLWLFYGTNYELSNGLLFYKSGPIKGKIEIETITEIIMDKTLWVGLKPATATKGIIIIYGKFKDELYISPLTNQLFVDEILTINPAIKITHP